MSQIRFWTGISSTLILFALSATVVRLSAEDTSKKSAPVEPKLVIYDDEHLKGKNVIVRKHVQDMKMLNFDNKSESMEWELPPNKAWVVFDEKNYRLPILVLVGKGAINDIGKEKRNALHSISSINLVNCGKGKRPTGIGKDVEIVGEYDEATSEGKKDDAPSTPMKDEKSKQATAGEIDENLLVGTWQVPIPQALAKNTFPAESFEKDGRYVTSLFQGGGKKLEGLEGTYKVEGDKLTITVGESSKTLQIKKVTDKELVLADGENLTTLNRVTDAPAIAPEKATKVPPSAITQKNIDRMEQALKAMPKAEKMDLTPAQEWKEKVDNGGVASASWRHWFPTVKTGDFVEYQNGDNSWVRYEVVSIENGVVTIATVFQISTRKVENRRGYKKLTRQQLDDQIKNTMGSGSDWRPQSGTEKSTVGDRELTCRIETHEVKDLKGKKTGKVLKRLSSDQVPFDGIVLQENTNDQPMVLLNYGRGK